MSRTGSLPLAGSFGPLLSDWRCWRLRSALEDIREDLLENAGAGGPAHAPDVLEPPIDHLMDLAAAVVDADEGVRGRPGVSPAPDLVVEGVDMAVFGRDNLPAQAIAERLRDTRPGATDDRDSAGHGLENR